MTTGICEICADATHPAAYACKRCKRILDRPEFRLDSQGRRRKFSREARKRALREAWDPATSSFRCAYTGVALKTDDHRARTYLSLEHQTPGDEEDIVIVSALINRMKTDLTDAEFRAMVSALAAKFAGGNFPKEAFPDTPQDGVQP